MIPRQRILSLRHFYAWLGIAYLVLITTGCLGINVLAAELDNSLVNHYLSDVVSERMAEPQLKEAIMGAILYLDDMQVRPRSGLRSSRYDSCNDGSCIPFFYLNISFLDSYFPILNPFCRIRNEVGEWISTIHFLPKEIGDLEGESIITLQDSNLFLTTATTYPMFLFSEESLGKHKVIQPMRQLAMQNIQKYKRGRSYNFWVEMDGVRGLSRRTGPYNIPIPFIEKLCHSYVDPANEDFWNRLDPNLDIPSRDWILKILDYRINPTGVDAAFNIPNDADDTSLAVVIQKLNRRDIPEIKVDLAALEEIKKYRDVGRRLEDLRDGWKGKNSGAFLTWLKDENLPTFSGPESGIIPLGTNNVDCVVNANVIFSLSLNGLNHFPGFDEANKLMLQVVKRGEWKNKCGLYYPQRMSFPYSITRAYRDGSIQHRAMTTAMELLLHDLLKEQRSDGSFSGGNDATTDLATALGVVSLLNIGRSIAEKQYLADRYDAAIRDGISFLLNRRKRHVIYNQETLQHFARQQSLSLADETYESVRSRFGYSWKSGLFFSASFWDLAQWRSEAYTVSIVLEALAKYLIAYDLGQVSISNGRRIAIERYAGSADEAERDFIIQVK